MRKDGSSRNGAIGILAAAALLASLGAYAAPAGKKPATDKPAAQPSQKEEKMAKKVLMIIAPKDFRDEELAEPKAAFEKAGYAITLASTTTSEVKGMFGLKAKPDKLISAVAAKDYDAVVFIGGSGSTVLFENADAKRLAREAVAENKILAAICLSPSILARAGVLKGLKATVWESEATTLTKNGATYVDQPVVREGKIITAFGPPAAKEYAKAIIEALK